MYTNEGGVLKVSKGALTMMKGYRKLYELDDFQGSTFIGDAVVPTPSFLDNDVTKFWYLRLSHMIENGMA